jgi:hypothetical protein
MSKNQVSVYAAGGGGINIVSDMKLDQAEPVEGFAQLIPYYIDTSEANTKHLHLPQENTYHFKNIDGSGSVRATNSAGIEKHCLEILQRFKPTKFNIVVHTGAGGSGSVIGPVIASALKKAGHQVIVILIGATDTRKSIENTLKTLKTYESISALTKLPVAVHYAENSETNGRAAVNTIAKSAITLVAGLLSGEHSELDSADLTNWLDYAKVTSARPQLVALNFITNKSAVPDFGTYLTVATLATPAMATMLVPTPDYQCVGYVPENWTRGGPNSRQIIGDEPIHYVISSEPIEEIAVKLSTALTSLDRAAESRVARNSILDAGETATTSGLIL